MGIKNLKIGIRLSISFLIIVAFMIAVSAIGTLRLAQLDKETDIIVHDRAPKIVSIHDYIVRLNRQARHFRNIILFDDAAQVKQELENIHIAKDQIGELYKKLDNGITSIKGRELLSRVANNRGQFGKLIEHFDDLVNAGNKDEAFKLLIKEVRPVQLGYMNSLNELIVYHIELMHKSGEKADETYLEARLQILGLTGGAIVLAFLIALGVTRSITRPLNEAVKIAQTVALGDLTSNIEVKSTDETGQLLQALKDMNDSLFKTVSQVRSSTDMIGTASSQIASGNMDLSSRTEQQASSLEETASSMEELTSTVRQNADNARQANQLAVTASEVAVKGGEVVSEVVETMGAINDSSKKMSDIISVIDGIAFQTNILALNAAVEAARAGEQGRGFAVVATEVRSLAQRSAAAAREIKSLIDNSVEKVTVGSKLVETAGATMEEVVSSIRRVHDIMSEITAASQEQSEGIEQVNQAIVQMDQVTQQNAALVEEAAAAAESLQDQSVVLTNVVSVFKLGGNWNASHAGQAIKLATTNTPALQKPDAALQLATVKRQPQRPSVDNNDEWETF